ncbi:MAG: Smr/MutS family protein [Bacteroidales bacterium]
MIYPVNFESKIGFDRIRSMLSDYCISPQGRRMVDELSFSFNPDEIVLRVTETSEFQHLIVFDDPFPSENYHDLSPVLGKLKVIGTFPEVNELWDLKRSLETLKAVIGYFRKKEDSVYPVLKARCNTVKLYPYVLDAADRIIDRHGAIKDNASPELRDIRSRLSEKSQLVTRRLNSILRQAQADGLVEAGANASVRNGRGVIPVNASDKRKLSGLVHDQSSTGKTVFIEPAEIVELNNDILDLEYEERREIIRILTSFADNIRPYLDDLSASSQFLGEIDFIRAKALMGRMLGSIKPVITRERLLNWRNAVHPLLFISFSKTRDRKVVPLNINLDGKNRLLLISGPNAGGKSVCLKTVGLLQYMLQCGLTIPVGEGSECGIFRNIFIDIGDEQSIENDLSTYSSHLNSMKFFLKNANEKTLVLIDEFGTGTEPMIGGAIAEAILSELNKMEVYGVITTHYTNLKHFASMTEGIVNGAMAFDNHLMQPLFQLFIGKPGSSFAFEIAKKIGLPENVLLDASGKAGVKNVNYDKHLRDIARDKRYWENKRQNIRQHEKQLEDLIDGYEKELSDIKQLRKEILSSAKTEAKSILDNSNKLIENTVRQIRETQAEREKTLELRKKVEEFREDLLNKDNTITGSTEAKAEELRKRAGKLVIKAKKENPEAKPVKTIIEKGALVRMKETMATGEIVKIEGKTAHVETGNLIIKVPLEKLERISAAEYRQSQRKTRSDIIVGDEINLRKLKFNPEIDIRGIRGDEAITRVRDLLDTALVIQHKNLRILHGKGNGILRELVRNYLASSGVVKIYRDEHVDLGGSGITVVELDI